MRKKRIGFIDSGIGGLTLLKKVIDRHGNSDFFYISDTTNVPYGNKSQDFMFEKMKEMSLKLIDKEVDGIFIACNTATAQTIDRLRSTFQEISFIGIEPFINYLNQPQFDQDQKIALILTEATYQSLRFKELIKKYDPNKIIQVFPLKKLAITIETLLSNNQDISSIENEVYAELDFLLMNQFTTLILGCTHYPIIKKIVEKRYNLKCIDPSSSVVDHLFNKISLTKNKKRKTLFYSNFDNSNLWTEDNIDKYKYLP